MRSISRNWDDTAHIYIYIELGDGEPGQQLMAKSALANDQNYFTVTTPRGSRPPVILTTETLTPIFAFLGIVHIKAQTIKNIVTKIHSLFFY